MIYNGEFRSIDTTIDPNGQLYKVVINTGINGKGAYYWVPDLLNPAALHPQEPINIELADDPFIVEYEGEENIYKPYKCSTATVRIMLDHIEKNFICTKKNDIMVMLLKWKNSVHKAIDENLKPIMIDEETGKKLPQYSVALGDGRIWTGFPPELYDDFCYDVEWMGYATPNTYSQAYTNIVEPFELECQDALSTLQYYDYSVESKNTRSFWDTIVQCISQIDSVYKHVYVTKSIVINPTDSRHAIEKLMCLDNNWFDEDNKPTNCLDVLFQIMQYLNCTMIQYKDDLYIINFDAIASEQRIYKQFIRIEDGIALPPHAITWNDKGGSVYLGSRFNIDGLKLASNGTNISTTSTYKKVEIQTNEYYPDSIIPDISDDEQITTHNPFQDILSNGNEIPMITNVTHAGTGNVEYTFGPAPLLFAGTMIDAKPEAPGSVETFNYKPDTYNINGSGTERWRWSNETMPKPISISDIVSTATPRICGCSMIEYGGNQLKTDSSAILNELMQNYNGKRMYWFYMWGINLEDTGVTPDGASTKFTPYSPYGKFYFRDKPELIQPMLKITTDKQLLRAATYKNGVRVKPGQHIQINGTWCFYNTPWLPTPAHWDDSVNETLKAKLNHMFTWVKIYTTDENGNKKYVQSAKTNTGVNYTYSWKTEAELPNEADRWCKLFYGGQGFTNSKVLKTGTLFNKTSTLVADSSAFETDFSIVKNNRAVDGTVIPLPEGNDFYGDITIEFNRPVGCGFENGFYDRYYYAWQATLTDFELNVIDDIELDYYRDSVINQCDGSYNIEMNDYAVDEFPTINSNLSSGFKKSTNLSNVYVNYNGRNSRVESISNNGCGISSMPEKIIINTIASTYKEPKIVLDIDLHAHNIDNYVIDTYVWKTQFPDINFVSNSFIINYEMDSLSVKLLEKPSLLSQNANFNNRTRNMRRNGDNLFNYVPRKDTVIIDDDKQPNLSTSMNIKRESTEVSQEGYKDLVVDDGMFGPGNLNPTAGLIKKANVEVNFDNGYAQLSHPDNMDITTTITNNGDLIIKY